MNAKILILDDDNFLAESLQYILEEEGFSVKISTNSRNFFEKYKEFQPDLIIMDILLGQGLLSGLEVLENLKIRNILNSKVIVFSASKTEENIKKSAELGVASFIEKNSSLEIGTMLLTIRHVLSWKNKEDENIELKIENVALKKKFAEEFNFVGKSKPTKRLKKKLRKLANSSVDVYIHGETGTGKELAAKTLYFYSDRFGRKFKVINCAAFDNSIIKEELFGYVDKNSKSKKYEKGIMEKSNGGILVLDDINKLSLQGQDLLLSFIDSRKIKILRGAKKKLDLRLIFTSNVSISQLVDTGKFRKELYYRIKKNMVEIYPLWKRTRDISNLIDYYLEKYSQRFGAVISTNTKKIKRFLSAYKWPGNVREIENFCRNLVQDNKKVTNDILMEEFKNQKIKAQLNLDNMSIPSKGDLKDITDEVEKNYIIFRLAQNKGNISKTAELIGLNRTTLYKKMAKHKIPIT